MGLGLIVRLLLQIRTKRNIMNLSKSEQIALPGASSGGAGVGESPPVVVFLLQVQGPAAIESPCCGSRAKAPSNSCQTASDSVRVLDGCAEAAAARQPVLSVPYIGLALDDRPERERGESRSMTVCDAQKPLNTLSGVEGLLSFLHCSCPRYVTRPFTVRAND